MTQTATTGIFRGFRGLISLFGLSKRSQDVLADPDGLHNSVHWKQFSSTWNEAEDIAAGRLGDYPFKRKGKKRLLAGLTLCSLSIDALEHDSTINTAEAGLLKKDIARLVDCISNFRTIEEADSDTRKTSIKTPALVSMTLLRERLDLLGQLAQAKSFNRTVVEKILVPFERVMKTLNNSTMLNQLAIARRSEAAELRQQGQQHLEIIKVKMSA